MRQKFLYLFMVLSSLCFVAIIFILTKREEALKQETLPHELLAAEASLIDQTKLRSEKFQTLFNEVPEPKIPAIFQMLTEFRLAHQDLLGIYLVDTKGDLIQVDPADGKNFWHFLKQQTFAQTWFQQIESNGSQAFTPILGAGNGKRILTQAVPVYDKGVLHCFVLLAYDTDLLLQIALPNWIKTKYEVEIVDQNNRPLAHTASGQTLQHSLSIQGQTDITGQKTYLKMTAFHQGITFSQLLLTSLSLGIIIGVSFVIYSLSQDLRKKRLLNEDLHRQNQVSEAKIQAKDYFIASMSHEIRTPLSAILGYTEVLLYQRLTHQAELWGIKRNAEQLLQLVGDILDYSRLQAKLLTPFKYEYEVSQLLEDLALTTVPQAENAQLSLQVVSLNEIPSKIYTDPIRLRQILVNLVSNAIKYTKAGGITVEFRVSDEGKLCIVVMDTGIGIPRDEQSLLFQSFTQIPSHRSHQVKGNGLGLAISQSLAQLIEAELNLVNSEVGVGSKFQLSFSLPSLASQERLSIPLQDLKNFAKARENLAGSTSSYQQVLNGRTILIVDDDADHRLILSTILSHSGGEILLAKGGQEALDLAQSKAISCILLDLSMPDINGYQTLAKFQEIGLRIPIIALTASALKSERESAIAAGFSEFFTKPIPFHQFPSLLAKILRQESPLDEPSVLRSVDQTSLSDEYQAHKQQFYLGLKDRREKLEREYRLENWAGLQREAHSLVGTAAAFGETELKMAAQQLELNLFEESGKTAIDLAFSPLIQELKRQEDKVS